MKDRRGEFVDQGKGRQSPLVVVCCCVIAFAIIFVSNAHTSLTAHGQFPKAYGFCIVDGGIVGNLFLVQRPAYPTPRGIGQVGYSGDVRFRKGVSENDQAVMLHEASQVGAKLLGTAAGATPTVIFEGEGQPVEGFVLEFSAP